MASLTDPSMQGLDRLTIFSTCCANSQAALLARRNSL